MTLLSQVTGRDRWKCVGEDDLFRHIPSGRASKCDAVELSAIDIGHAVDIDHLVGSHAGVEVALDGATVEIEIVFYLDAAALVGIAELIGVGSALCSEEDVGDGIVGSPLGADGEVVAAADSARAVGIGANVEAAVVPDAKSSAVFITPLLRSRWVWPSRKPGNTQHPEASTRVAPCAGRPGAIAVIFPSSMARSACSIPPGVTRVPFCTIVIANSPLGFILSQFWESEKSKSVPDRNARPGSGFRHGCGSRCGPRCPRPPFPAA